MFQVKKNQKIAKRTGNRPIISLKQLKTTTDANELENIQSWMDSLFLRKLNKLYFMERRTLRERKSPLKIQLCNKTPPIFF